MLKQSLNLSNPNVFIYYVTYNRGKYVSIEQGHYLYFREGKLVGEMLTKDEIPKGMRMATSIHSHLRAVTKMLQTFGYFLNYPVHGERYGITGGVSDGNFKDVPIIEPLQFFKSPPIIYTHSKMAKQWFEKGHYKGHVFSNNTKVELWTLLNHYQPQFELYDSTAKPFCLLREMCLEQNVVLKQRKGKFNDWSNL